MNTLRFIPAGSSFFAYTQGMADLGSSISEWLSDGQGPTGVSEAEASVQRVITTLRWLTWLTTGIIQSLVMITTTSCGDNRHRQPQSPAGAAQRHMRGPPSSCPEGEERMRRKWAPFLVTHCSQRDTEKDIDSIRFCPFVICHYCIQQAGVWMKMSNQDGKKEKKKSRKLPYDPGWMVRNPFQSLLCNY